MWGQLGSWSDGQASSRGTGSWLNPAQEGALPAPALARQQHRAACQQRGASRPWSRPQPQPQPADPPARRAALPRPFMAKVATALLASSSSTSTSWLTKVLPSSESGRPSSGLMRYLAAASPPAFEGVQGWEGEWGTSSGKHHCCRS
jgi:hypothetical protein